MLHQLGCILWIAWLVRSSFAASAQLRSIERSIGLLELTVKEDTHSVSAGGHTFSNLQNEALNFAAGFAPVTTTLPARIGFLETKVKEDTAIENSAVEKAVAEKVVAEKAAAPRAAAGLAKGRRKPERSTTQTVTKTSRQRTRARAKLILRQLWKTRRARRRRPPPTCARERRGGWQGGH